MKTSLYFEAPSDLSVGTVRIIGEGHTIAEWIATPDNRTFRQDELQPGFYSAEIGPAGLSPQSVFFEIREGQANNVVLPTFSALSSSGSNTSFYDPQSLRTVADSPYSATRHLLSYSGIRPIEAGATLDDLAKSEASVSVKQVELSTDTRRISIGLSEEVAGRDTFGTYRGVSHIELASGGVGIEIPTDAQRRYRTDSRVRLSAAIENLRIERCLLPLYRGGTRISIASPPFAPSDVEFNVMPMDPKLRALVRALEVGSSAEARAVRDDVVATWDLDSLLDEEGGDPWAAMLVGLLAIRFPEIFDPVSIAWADELVSHAGWAFDTHVISANRTLTAANGSNFEIQSAAVVRAVGLLAKAQVSGSPYYRYTNQLFGEMAAGISAFLKQNKPQVEAADLTRFERLNARWQRELPLQRGAGPTFTWLARDLEALKHRDVLVPYRHPSGKLRSSHAAVVFEGRVGAGQITIIRSPQRTEYLIPEESGGTGSPSWLNESVAMPALLRAIGPHNDPNRGRFGGVRVQAGFRLDASFEPLQGRDRVTVVLYVEAERGMELPLGEYAWFVLHPTFFPWEVKVNFRGNRAKLRVQAAGGFTVGVWLPQSGVELEYDLAEAPDAPRIIRLR